MTHPATEGVLLVDKPEGMTSHDVVAVARGALRERRIGHAGTLDPFATGLLVLMVGRATRLLPYIDGEPKVYEATIRFGAETATDDRSGAVVREGAIPDPDAVHAGIARLTGPIDQVPSAYSAKKVDGVRAYAAARRGAALDLPAVPVVVHGWEVREASGADWDVVVTCGAGTYVRALARDLGRLAGSAAHLVRLRRIRSGCFAAADACALEAVRDGTCTVLPARDAVGGMATRTLGPVELQRIATGQSLAAGANDGRVALVDGEGVLVAVAERVGDRLQPRLVLRAG